MIARGWLPLSLYVFLTLPINIITVNYYQLDNSPRVLLMILALGLIVSSFLVYKVFNDPNDNLNHKISLRFMLPILILFLFIYFDFATPLRGESLSGLKVDGKLVADKDLLLDFWILTFTMILVILAFLYKWQYSKATFIGISKIALVFSSALFLTNVVDSWKVVPWKSYISKISNPQPRPALDNLPTDSESRPNVYHLIFDAFGSAYFEQALAASDRPSLLREFIFFDDARGNYDHTVPSIASVRLGRMAMLDENFSTFISESKTNGIDNIMKQNGYRVSSYNENQSWVSSSSDYYYTNEFAATDYLGSRNMKSALLFDFWVMRLLPSFAQTFYYQNGNGFLSRLNPSISDSAAIIDGEGERTAASMFLVRQLIKDEVSRRKFNEYIFMHSYLTHGPYVVKSDCSLRSNQTNSKDPSVYYLPQTICALNLLQNLIETLIMQGKYESSMIVVHADHGTWEVGLSQNSITDRLLSSSLIDNPRLVPPEYVVNQSNPLLLVKLPVDTQNINIIDAPRNKLRPNPKPVSLIDIMPSILSFVDIDYSSLNLEGVDIFGPSIERRQWRNFQMGFKQVTDPISRSTHTLGDNNPELIQQRYKIYPNGTFTKDISYDGKW